MLLVTARERDCVVAMLEGLRPAAIAEKLGISVKTFSTLRARLLRRNGLKTDTQVGFIVAMEGLTLTSPKDVEFNRIHNAQVITSGR